MSDTYQTNVYLEQGGDKLVIKEDGVLEVSGQIQAPDGQAAAISDPTGGVTEDAEARTAINDIIDALEGVGIIAASS